MGYDDRREIFERLEALERRMGSRHDDHRSSEGGHRGDGRHERRDRRHHDRHDRGRGRNGGDFDEKRIIDTIVRLVSEHVECIIEDTLDRNHPQGGGDEKRIVDLIVSLVSEHVQQIVATELDRRLGPAGDGPRGEPEPPRD